MHLIPKLKSFLHLYFSKHRNILEGTILFYCTPLTAYSDMRRVYRGLTEYTSLLQLALMDNGVRYSRCALLDACIKYPIRFSFSPRFLPSARSNLLPLYIWQKTFFTEDKDDVGNILPGLKWGGAHGQDSLRRPNRYNPYLIKAL